MTFPMLQDKVAIVTGAATGMGAATAELFAAAGARVTVADVDVEQGESVVAGIVERGGSALFVATDVASSDQLRALVQVTVEHFGRLDVAVNNAAVKPDEHPMSELNEDYWDTLMSVDLKGVALSMKWELRQLLAQGDGGSVINISSISGFRPQPNNAAYVAAKHGVVGLGKVAALENGQFGIRVNTVAPGAIDTPMLRNALVLAGQTEREFAPNLSLLGRVGRADEVAQASLWLASDLSSYVTGSVLHVDAGYTGR